MQIPGVHIETLSPPSQYTPAQLDKAVVIAAQLDRGKLLIVEPPANPPA